MVKMKLEVETFAVRISNSQEGGNIRGPLLCANSYN